MDGLRDVWFEDISIQRLTDNPDWVPWWGIATKKVFKTLRLGGIPFISKALSRGGILNDKKIIAAILKAVTGILHSGNGRPSLMPDGHRLDLTVNTTDFAGLPYYIPVVDPVRRKPVYDLRHNVPLAFSNHGSGIGDFDKLGMLTFACRSTSSFPGAFRALKIDDITEVAFNGNAAWIEDENVENDFFPMYGFADYNGNFPTVFERSYIDGGVRDNKPFGHTIKAIMSRPADREVVRRLLYLEPHPKVLDEKPGDKRPRLATVAAKALTSIGGYEPIHGELWALEESNRKAKRLKAYICHTEKEVRVALTRVAMAVTNDLNVWRDWANWEANVRSVGQDPYVTFKLHGIPDGITNAICRALDFPEESSHAYFVRRVIWHHLISEHWINAPGEAPLGDDGKVSEASIRLLKSLDIAYQIRRVRFVLYTVNQLFGEADETTSAALGGLKESLWKELAAYTEITDEFAREKAGHLADLFPKAQLDELVRGGDESAASFAEERKDAMAGLLRDAMTAVGGCKETIRADFSRAYDVLGSVSERIRTHVLERTVAFPFWDRSLYPIMETAGLGDFDEIQVMRMSPYDSGEVMGYMDSDAAPVKKEIKGMTLGHFGAFMTRKGREMDYLWGHTAERLIDILADAVGNPGMDLLTEKKAAMTAILNAEEPTLNKAGRLIRKMRRAI